MRYDPIQLIDRSSIISALARKFEWTGQKLSVPIRLVRMLTPAQGKAEETIEYTVRLGGAWITDRRATSAHEAIDQINTLILNHLAREARKQPAAAAAPQPAELCA